MQAVTWLLIAELGIPFLGGIIIATLLMSDASYGSGAALLVFVAGFVAMLSIAYECGRWRANELCREYSVGQRFAWVIAATLAAPVSIVVNVFLILVAINS